MDLIHRFWWEKFIPAAKWFTVQKIYFHRGQSYISLTDTFITMFLVWGVWMDKLPFEVTPLIIVLFLSGYITIVNRIGKLDFDKGVAKFEAEFGTRELNPFYTKLENDIQKVIGLLEAQENRKSSAE